MSSVLNGIYRDNLRFLARWHTAYANHLSMAAAARFLMRDHAEVTEAQMLEEADAYATNLTPMRTNSARLDLRQLDWQRQRQLLGHDDLYESWLDLFREALATDVDATLRRWLERLGFGVSAAAGHSIIRLHYALAVRDQLDPDTLRDELAVSLADFASRYTVLTQDSLQTPLRPRALERFLEHHPPLDAEDLALFESATVIEVRLWIARTLPAFQSAARSIDTDFDIMACVRRLAAIATQCGDFTLLHNLTVGQALIDIIDWLEMDSSASLRQGYRDFVVASVLCAALPDADLNREQPAPSLEAIYERVPTLTDDHAVKASYSLTRLYQMQPEPAFLSAASTFQSTYG